MPANGALTGKELLTDVQEEIKKSNERLKEFLATYVQLKKEAATFTTANGGNRIIKETAELDGKVNAELKERNRLLKAVETQQAKNNQVNSEASKELTKQRLESQRANKANRENAILTSRFSTEYEKLSIRLRRARQELKELVLTQGQNSVATRKAAAEVQNLDSKLKRADAIAGQFQRNVGNYPSALKPAIGVLRQLVGVFGLYEGVRIGLDITKESLELARQAKGVEFAFQRLGSTGVKAFNDVRKSSAGLLSELDIKRSLVELDNFNINLEQAGTLFEFLTVRATQTGVSIDKLKDSLVEGLSKESLLRIDNLGISTAELNEQLKITPNFVEAVAEIAKKEIAEAGDIINEAANSQDRFNSSLENAKKSFGQLLQGDGLSFFGILADRIDKIDQAFQFLKVGLESLRQGLNNFITPIKDLIQRVPLLNAAFSKTSGFITELYKVFSNPGLTVFSLALIEMGKVLSGLGSAFVAVKDEAINFIRTLARFGDIDFSLDPIKNFKNIKNFFNEAKDEFLQGGRNIADAFNEGYNKTFKIDKPEPPKVEDIITTEDIAPVREKLKNVVDVFEEEYKRAENLFEAFKKVLDFSDPSLITAIDASTIGDALSEISKGFEKVRDDAKITSDELKDIYSGLFSSFGDYYGIDLTAFENLLSGKEASLNEYAEFAKSVASSILDSRLISYENEIAANQEKLDAILSDETVSEEKKQIAERKFVLEEKKIRLAQAKAERENILIQIGIDTAAAVAKVLAQTGIVAPAVIPTILALGAAQAAFVAAQPLPKFFKGKKATDSFEGLATWGEHRKEVLVDKHGNISVSPNRTTPLFVQKDDIIMPSISSFNREIKDPYSDVSKRLAMKLDSDTKEGMNMIKVHTTAPNISTEGIRQEIKQGIKQGFKGLKLPKYPDNYSRY